MVCVVFGLLILLLYLYLCLCLLLFFCVSGSSSDYGVQKALKETTVAMLEAHGVTPAEEKEYSKVGRSVGRLVGWSVGSVTAAVSL